MNCSLVKYLIMTLFLFYIFENSFIHTTLSTPVPPSILVLACGCCLTAAMPIGVKYIVSFLLIFGGLHVKDTCHSRWLQATAWQQRQWETWYWSDWRGTWPLQSWWKSWYIFQSRWCIFCPAFYLHEVQCSSQVWIFKCGHKVIAICAKSSSRLSSRTDVFWVFTYNFGLVGQNYVQMRWATAFIHSLLALLTFVHNGTSTNTRIKANTLSYVAYSA